MEDEKDQIIGLLKKKIEIAREKEDSMTERLYNDEKELLVRLNVKVEHEIFQGQL